MPVVLSSKNPCLPLVDRCEARKQDLPDVLNE
jgi:hypothetical protein